MQLIGVDNDHLGYYVDIDTPMRKVGSEYYLTDLFLDLWIAPDGKYIELDQDEFEQGFRMGLLTSYQFKKANHVFEKLKLEVSNGEFFLKIH
jgi:predicted RNA-binding protein associated with RNAse of E/G family